MGVPARSEYAAAAAFCRLTPGIALRAGGARQFSM
jgi:hypothetical protein